MADGGWEQILIYFMLGVLPWIFVVVGGWFIWDAYKFMGNVSRTIGTVTGVHQSTSTSGSGSDRRLVTTYKPVFEYEDRSGQTQKAETFIYSTSYNFGVGEQREILVNPDRPDKVKMPGLMIYGFGAIFVSIGLVFGIVGLFAMQNM